MTKQATYRNKNVSLKRPCDFCRKAYRPARSTSRFCSDRCRVYAARGAKRHITHVVNNSGRNEWYTPPEYIEAARRTMGSIDLDPASSEIAQRVVRATAFYTIDDDGLAQGWAGNVWLNPPYSKELIGLFVDKLCASPITQACVLVNNATDTSWFKRLSDRSAAICHHTGRIRFLRPTGKQGAPLQGQVVLYIGTNTQSFAEHFGPFGAVWNRSVQP